MGGKNGELGRWQIVPRQESKLLSCMEGFWHRDGDQIFISGKYFRHQPINGAGGGEGGKVVRLEEHKSMGGLKAS